MTLHTDVPETDAGGNVQSAEMIRISEILGQDQKLLERGNWSIQIRVGRLPVGSTRRLGQDFSVPFPLRVSLQMFGE